MKRLLVGPVTALALIVLLTGCSGTTSRTSSSRALAPTTTAASQATTSTVVRPHSTTSTYDGALPGAGNQCTPGDLRPRWPGVGNGASGHLFYNVYLDNISRHACVSGGYVGVAAYDPAGLLIPASEQRDPGIAPSNALSVAPGESMQFIIGLPNVDIEAGATACSTVVGALHLIPPNETMDVQVATPTGRSYPKLCGNSFLVGPLT